jgi:hypothetical protein
MRRVLPVCLVVLASACTPFGGGIFEGGGGSSGSFSSPIPGGPGLGPRDAQAQGLLFQALGDAMSSTGSVGGSFAGIDPRTVASFDPQLHVAGDVPARVGTVSINLAASDGLVMSTKSTSGTVYCISMSSSAGFAVPQGGTVDAHGATSVRACTGKDWVLNP